MNINSLPKNLTLVVGGAGFIGHSFVEHLSKLGNRNVAIIGRSSEPRTKLPQNTFYLSGDISDERFIRPLLEKTTEVVDLAYGTTPKTSFEDPVRDVILNLPFSVSLMRMSCEHDIGRYLLVSSGGTVYGNTSSLPIRENEPNNPISPYGISKLVTEKYGQFFHKLGKLPLLIARPANAYGLMQVGKYSQGFIGVAIHAALNGQPIEIYGRRGSIRDYIYISDMASGLCSILDKGLIGEIYNIGTSVGHDNMDVIQTLGNLIGDSHPLKIVHLDERPFDVPANVLNYEKLKATTNWSPAYSLKDGVAEILKLIDK
jgi:UDP-glucose 4-epimerase